MRVSGQLHTLAALPSGKQAAHYLLNRGLGWTLELVWVPWRKEKFHAPAWNPTPFPCVSSPQPHPSYEPPDICRVLFLAYCIALNIV
jgi:hypothetical protein